MSTLMQDLWGLTKTIISSDDHVDAIWKAVPTFVAARTLGYLGLPMPVALTAGLFKLYSTLYQDTSDATQGENNDSIYDYFYNLKNNLASDEPKHKAMQDTIRSTLQSWSVPDYLTESVVPAKQKPQSWFSRITSPSTWFKSAPAPQANVAPAQNSNAKPANLFDRVLRTIGSAIGRLFTDLFSTVANYLVPAKQGQKTSPYSYDRVMSGLKAQPGVKAFAQGFTEAVHPKTKSAPANVEKAYVQEMPDENLQEEAAPARERSMSM